MPSKLFKLTQKILFWLNKRLHKQTLLAQWWKKKYCRFPHKLFEWSWFDIVSDYLIMMTLNFQFWQNITLNLNTNNFISLFLNMKHHITFAIPKFNKYNFLAAIRDTMELAHCVKFKYWADFSFRLFSFYI